MRTGVRYQLIRSVFLFIAFFLFKNAFCQTQNVHDITVPPAAGHRCRAEIVNGDTLPVVDLQTIYVYAEFVFKNRKHFEMWTRTKQRVKNVYPYAILAAAKLKEYDKALAGINDSKLRKAFLKVCEKDLRKEFEDELKQMSVEEGKVLMKLIDRESGKTTYEIVQQMRGNFQAMMWQTIARLFGNNMKTEYDPVIEDLMIERAVKLVEMGQF
jgi:hypothetical protein